jgi:hypothetical protein
MRSVRQYVPLTSFAALLALASAALPIGQASKAPTQQPDRNRSMVASGRLLGNRELLQVSVSQTEGTVALVIESVTANPKILWQANSRNSETNIDSVRIADLDGDGIPELLTLWWKGSSAALRIFHWDANQRSFVEIPLDEEIDNVRSYRVEHKVGRLSSRLVVDSRSAPSSGLTAREYELRDSRLVRSGGGLDVKTTGESGIEGQALISPAHPGPLRQGEPASVPFKTTIVVWNTGDGREVTRVDTGSDGRFRVTMRPGTYRVGPPQQTGRFLPRASEETVTVTAGKFVQVTINFDSGIR